MTPLPAQMKSPSIPNRLNGYGENHVIFHTFPIRIEQLWKRQTSKTELNPNIWQINSCGRDSNKFWGQTLIRFAEVIRSRKGAAKQKVRSDDKVTHNSLILFIRAAQRQFWENEQFVPKIESKQWVFALNKRLNDFEKPNALQFDRCLYNAVWTSNMTTCDWQCW